MKSLFNHRSIALSLNPLLRLLRFIRLARREVKARQDRLALLVLLAQQGRQVHLVLRGRKGRLVLPARKVSKV